MLTALEQFPLEEYRSRIQKCKQIMEEDIPETDGLLVFSRLNIYYLTGTLGTGVFLIPKNGEPILFLYRGIERAKLESPVQHICHFSSFKDIPLLCKEIDNHFPSIVAIEKQGLTLTTAEMLFTQLPNISNSKSCDTVLNKVRLIKSEWELKKLHICGERHRYILEEAFPQKLVSNTSELEIAHQLWSQFFTQGHQGIIRCNEYSEEFFLGYVSAGESGFYPSYFNTPLTGRGVHPAAPFMGDAGTIWKHHTILSVDVCFMLEGYHTVKTQIYWPGVLSSIPDKIKQAQDVCIEVYERVISMLIPGAVPEDIWSMAQKYLQSIKIPGTFMGSGKDIVSFLGHGVGLAIDEGPIFEKGSCIPLKEGMVIAIEPKISIPGLGTVGVENTLEITNNGVSSLTGAHLNIIPV